MSKTPYRPTSAADLTAAIERSDETTADVLRSCQSASTLEPVAAAWKTDERQAARQARRDYLAEPMNAAGQQTVVKQLFKQAEDDGDLDTLAVCLVALDRTVRHKRVGSYQWDRDARQWTRVTLLKLPARKVPTESRTPPPTFFGQQPAPHGAIFSYRTRYYLRRRAWRFFRRLGHQQPGRYVEAVAAALRLYRDDDLDRGEAILESWGLMHICYGKSPAIRKSTTHIVLKSGYGMDDLKPAPYFEPLWQTDDAAAVLFDLVHEAAASLVRQWAWAMLRTHHGDWLAGREPAQLIALFDHADEAIVADAAALFRDSSRLSELSVSQWIGLLDVANPLALGVVCEAISDHVDAATLPTGDCVALLVRPATPVALLALRWLDPRSIDLETERDLLRTASQAESEAAGTDIADWVLSHAGTSKQYDRDVCSDLLDSRNAAIRAEAWNWLAEEASPGQADPALWARLVETPYDDLRLPLIDLLSRRAERAVPTGLGADRLVPVWTGVLASVARGSRQKLRAIDQLREAISRQPERAEELLPVLRIAVRSLRGPEHAHALAAVVELGTRQPELAESIETAIPELSLAGASS